MRISAQVAIPLLGFMLAGQGLWAQQRPAVSPTGFGRVLFPGGGGPGTVVNANGPNVSNPFGRIVYPGTGAPVASRGRGNLLVAPPYIGHPVHGTALVPYPVFLDSAYYDYEPPTAPYIAGYTPVAYAPGGTQAQEPVVIVNQYFQAEAPAPPPAPATAAAPAAAARTYVTSTPAPVYYYIVMKSDHYVAVAKSYSVQGDTLNYTTPEGDTNSVSLDLVDRPLSTQVNHNRSVAFGVQGE